MFGNRISLFILLFSITFFGAKSQSLTGQVVLNDQTPAQFATVYIPSLGIGAITDTQGQYYLSGVPSKDVVVEISYIGYTTHRAQLDTLVIGNTLRTISLYEQPITLTEVFITPNGEDPVTYIFRRIHQQALKNKKTLQYDATITSSFLSQDLDVIKLILPKFALWVLKRVISMTSAGDLFDYCIDHEKIQAKGRIECHTQNGKCKYDGWAQLESTLSDSGFEKKLKKQTAIDPFQFVYEDFLKPKDLPEGYTLIGTIEEDGRTIDVLRESSTFTIKEGKIYGDTTYLYVVEEDWGILRQEHRSADGITRMECRNIGNGIWLPISYIDDPAIIDLNSAIKEAFNDPSNYDDMSRTERKYLDRFRDIANGKRQFHPCFTMCYNIKYR